MKKRLVVLVMASMLVFALAGCGKKNAGSNTNNEVAENAEAGTGTENTEDTEAEENQDAASQENTSEVITAEKVEVADSADVLNKVWDTFEETQKFAAMGGDFNTPVDNAAGIFNIEDTENLTYMLYLPAENVEMIDEAASLMHAMNANTFTGAAFHVTDAANAQVLISALKENILNTQWMCGFPDKLMIFTVNDEYVVSAFGNAEIMENFKTGLMEVYGDAAVFVLEETIS